MVVFSAILAGVGVLLAGNVPWTVLAALNQRLGTALPWALAPMSAYLAVYWGYASGRLGSRSSAAVRRAGLRANPLTAEAWATALLTGLVGFGALLAFLIVMARVVPMPDSTPLTAPAGMPRPTMFVLLVMSSIVAGVTEEAAFRGYMQGPVERRYGLAAGILVSGTMFGLLHFPNHPDAIASMVPYYLAVSSVYGGLVWATNSILPALVLHVGGDIWSLTRLWLTGRPEWQLLPQPLPLVGASGVDASFVAALTGSFVLAALFVVLCRRLHAGASTTYPAAALQ